MSETSQTPYEIIRAKCMASGLTLRAACIEAGVPYPTIAGWKRETPKALEYVQRIEKVVEAKNAKA